MARLGSHTVSGTGRQPLPQQAAVAALSQRRADGEHGERTEQRGTGRQRGSQREKGKQRHTRTETNRERERETKRDCCLSSSFLTSTTATSAYISTSGSIDNPMMTQYRRSKPNDEAIKLSWQKRSCEYKYSMSRLQTCTSTVRRTVHTVLSYYTYSISHYSVRTGTPYVPLLQVRIPVYVYTWRVPSTRTVPVYTVLVYFSYE